MTIFRSSLFLGALALTSCTSPAQREAEADAREEGAEREADLNQLRSEVNVMANTARALKAQSDRYAAEWRERRAAREEAGELPAEAANVAE